MIFRIYGVLIFAALLFVNTGHAAEFIPASAPDYQAWKLPRQPAAPADNLTTPARVELGKMLFFDPRLSRNGNISCSSCHNPSLGWSDGLALGRGFDGKALGRASPSIVNSGFNTIHMWDGRAKSLEAQATGPMEAAVEMNSDLDKVFVWLNASTGYKAAFARAYPGQPIGLETLRRALASFERTVVSRTSPFDRWVAGDKRAMSAQQLRGMALFNNREKTNCVACHAAPNFTDNGFHNLGLAQFGSDQPDMGRYEQKKVALMKGAFKTPSLRDVELTAPYFHDGSAATLMDVVEHYAKGGENRTNLSPNIKPLSLTAADKEALVVFMRALTSPQAKISYPSLPHE